MTPADDRDAADLLRETPPGTVWTLAGATATGKSAVAQWIAERHGAAILSADSMLVYRGMDIGTAKPAPAERGAVPYIGLDCVEPGDSFSTGAWLECVRRGLGALSPPRPVIAVGGTGLYFRALLAGLDGAPADPARRRHWQELFASEGLEGLWRALDALGDAVSLPPGERDNPRRCIRALEHAEAAATSGASAASRPSPDHPRPPIVALRLPRDQLHARIERRVRRMFADGLVAEAVALRRQQPLSATALQGIGYAEALALADGIMSPGEAIERVAARTRQLAKRQMTWFRHQAEVHWIDITDDTPVPVAARLVLNSWRQHGPAPIH